MARIRHELLSDLDVWAPVMGIDLIRAEIGQHHGRYKTFRGNSTSIWLGYQF